MQSNIHGKNCLHVMDCIRGKVTGKCDKGTFLSLENGEEAFAKFGGLSIGTTVFCTVLKRATDTWRVLVSIDSIEYTAVA